MGTKMSIFCLLVWTNIRPGTPLLFLLVTFIVDVCPNRRPKKCRTQESDDDSMPKMESRRILRTIYERRANARYDRPKSVGETSSFRSTFVRTLQDFQNHLSVQ